METVCPSIYSSITLSFMRLSFGSQPRWCRSWGERDDKGNAIRKLEAVENQGVAQAPRPTRLRRRRFFLQTSSAFPLLYPCCSQSRNCVSDDTQSPATGDRLLAGTAPNLPSRILQAGYDTPPLRRLHLTSGDTTPISQDGDEFCDL